MRNYITLELRKNRVLFYGMAAAFIVSLPLIIGISRWNELPVRKGLDAGLLAWTLGGLPLLAMLFGASGGVRMRGENENGAETLLPLSPSERALGGVAAAAMHLAALSLLVLGLSCLLSPMWRQVLIQEVTAVTEWQTLSYQNPFIRPFFGVLAFTMAYTMIVSFTCAYVFHQGIIGAAVGLVLGLSMGAALTGGLGLQAIFSFRAPFTARMLCVVAVGLPASLWALRRAAGWVERWTRPGWVGGTAILLALLTAGISGAAALGSTYQRLSRSLAVTNRGLFAPSHWSSQELLMDASVWRQERKTALFTSYGGELLRIKPDGTRETLAEGGARFSDYMSAFTLTRYSGVTQDAQGGVWAIVQSIQDDKMHYEVRHRYPDGRWEVHTPLDFRFEAFLWRRGRLGLYRWTGKGFGFAELGEKGKPLRWESFSYASDDFILKMWEAESKAAMIHPHELKTAAETWKMPAGHVALSTGTLTPRIPVGGGGLFIVRVVKMKEAEGKRKVHIAICHPDGRVTLREGYGDLNRDWSRVGAEGLLWNISLSSELSFISSDGKLFPVLEMKDYVQDLKERKRRYRHALYPVHAEGDTVWVMVQSRRVVKMDLRTGKELERWDLPNIFEYGPYPEESTRVTDTGMFFLTGRELYFIRWDGSRKYLGEA